MGETTESLVSVSGSLPDTDSSLTFQQRAADLHSARQELYRQLGATAAALNQDEKFLLELLQAYASHNSSSLYNFTIYNAYSRIQREYLGEGSARILEIGPGINLGVGLLFALGGAEKYYGLDVYMDPDVFAAPQYESILYMLELTGAKTTTNVGSVMTLKDGKVEFVKERIEYLYPCQSYDIPVADASLDYVFSHATFEHVADPGQTVQAIYRVLRTGGITAHQIDLRDHADVSKPLEFLKVDEHTWREQWKDPRRTAWHLNRWRASDFTSAFERAGFRIIRVHVNATFPVDEALRGTLDPMFQNHTLEDLSQTGVMIVARKV